MDYEKYLEDYFIASKGFSYDDFFNPRRPFIQNLEAMVKRLRNLINKGASFRIIGDYDCDGICSAYILEEGLKNAGANKITVRLPDRFTDGYGLNKNMVLETTEDVIITVDNGITAHDAVKYAKSLGKEVLIIDHHEPTVKEGQIILPCADIIIDQKAFSGCSNDFCGAGLALQVIEYLVTNKPWVINKCYILAALATIADVVNVTDWNRKIIEHGIACINTNTDIPKGLKKILEHQALSSVDANALAFRVCPMINAPGRMALRGAEISLNLLKAETWEEATLLTTEVVELNNRRKDETSKGVEQANELIERECLFGDIMPIFLENIGEGVLGIVAGRIAENYTNTVGVFSRTIDKDGDDVFKGSFRSNGINIKAVLDEINTTGIIKKYGGHEGAAGISVLADKKVEFINALNSINTDKFMVQVSSDDTVNEIVEVEVSDLEYFNSLLEVYQPFGRGNRPPKVKVTNMELYPRNGMLFSISDKETIKLYGKGFNAIGFNLYPEYIKMGEPKKLNVTGNIRMSYGGKSKEIQIVMDTFEAVKTETHETSLAKALRERMSFL